MKNLFWAIAAIAAAMTLAWSVRVIAAGPDIASVLSDICYDDLGNQTIVKAGAKCPPDQQHRTKMIPQQQPDPADDPMTQLQQQVTDLVAKVSVLQARIDDSKKDDSKSDKADADEGEAQDKQDSKKATQSSSSGSAANQRVTAPFEVVDSHGKVILRVAEDASAAKGARVTIGAGPRNNYAVRVYNEGSQLVSGLGQGPDGGGVVGVFEKGSVIASMSTTDRAISVFKGDTAAATIKTTDNGGEMTVYNKGGTPVSHVSVTGVGGGAIVVARQDGFGLFAAQAEANGGGSACVNRISGAGKQMKNCLGIGLPLQMN